MWSEGEWITDETEKQGPDHIGIFLQPEPYSETSGQPLKDL